MITIDKIYTSNPLVDNIIYYAKLLALNSIVKDSEEADSNETVESLRNGDLLIASIEGSVTYEILPWVPKEVLAKWIKIKSNIDMYAENDTALRTHLNSYSQYQRSILLGNLSSLARTIYIDHYDIMMYYINNTDDTWLSDNEELYNSCKEGAATYVDLFDKLPSYTVSRIVKTYLNNYDKRYFDAIVFSLDTFQDYIDSRDDMAINTELDYINIAMRSVFISHYDMMVERGYLSEDTKNWLDYISYTDIYTKCKNDSVTYQELYPLFPYDDLKECLSSVLGKALVNSYRLADDITALEDYFSSVSLDPDTEIEEVTNVLIERYMKNYNPMMNFDIYSKCKDNLLNYFDLSKYLPLETKKMIINTFIDETSNLQAYEDNKNMLNEFLASIPYEERETIKRGIEESIKEWYPKNHVETNNYYRAYAGLAPLNNGDKVKDTLLATYDIKTKSYIRFGDKFTSRLKNTIYPMTHWSQDLDKFDIYDLNILKNTGVLDDYIEECNKLTDDKLRYRYLSFLGDEKIDIYTTRKADKFSLMKIPVVDDPDVRSKFLDSYNITKDYVMKTVYTDAYKFQSPYYDKFIIVFILINTIMDLLTTIPELFIDREVFDSRCIKYLFESYGIPYYSEIPIKYQRAMVKNLNILIKYKSSTRNMIDICSLFGFKDIRVFNYYMFKEYAKDTNTGDYITVENNDITYDLDKLYIKDETGEVVDLDGVRYSKLLEYRYFDPEKHLKTVTVENDDGSITQKSIMNNDFDYYIEDPEDPGCFILYRDLDYFTKIKANTKATDVKFIKVPIGESIADYKNREEHIARYDDIVYNDEGNTWDGGLIHEDLKQRILDYEFNAVRTKYISIETITDMTEMAFEMSYFYNMLFDNIYSEDSITLEIPQIKQGHKFRFMDIVCYLFAAMYLYNGLEDTIMYSPTQILYVKGYNFDESLNKIINDPRYFSQEDEFGPLEDWEKKNIFDINAMIESENYDYQEAFKYFDIRSFNLKADIDELEKWLNDNYQMSLDDFIVDDTLKDFSQIITLRNFFSMNNSFYQKDIFDSSHIMPMEYNNDIKYAFGYDIYKKSILKDINDYSHYFITVDEANYELIDDTSDNVYVMNYDKYLEYNNESIAVYYRYIRQDDGTLTNTGLQVYRQTADRYARIFDDNIYIRDTEGTYIMAKNAFYHKIEGEFVEIVEDRFFTQDPFEPLKKVLLFGQYYIQDENGNWVLDPENCYVKIQHGDETLYVLATDEDMYGTITVKEEDCYLWHSDLHFVRLIDTDYYRRTHDDDSDSYDEFVFDEEACYIITDHETEYYDPSVNPRVYYMKLEDYYRENEYVIMSGVYYVKDADGNFIPESSLIHPKNCYYINENGDYTLAIYDLGIYKKYDDSSKFNVDFILVLNQNYDYTKLQYNDIYKNYEVVEDANVRWVYNKSPDYAIRLYTDKTYDDTKEFIVIFNKLMDGIDRVPEDDETDRRYDAEVVDKVWDENDWMYTDPSYDEDNAVGMNGENKWYYRKPGSPAPEEDEYEDHQVATGFYLSTYAYIGDTTLIPGEKYFFSFDIECNFGCRMQICCEADDSVKSQTDRLYELTPDDSYHVTQTFTATDMANPRIVFLVYDYDQFPIEKGAHVIIKNIRFFKSYNDHFVSNDIPSFDKLLELYRTNSAIYKYLATKMAECSDYDVYQMYKHLYDSLMISKYNKEAFKIGDRKYARTYTEFLNTRDIELYNRLINYRSMETESMNKSIADDIVNITYALDKYIDIYNYQYLYSYFPGVSGSYIQQYISKVINFFKSWKVHLLGINSIYKFDDALENTIKILEDTFFRNKIKCNSKVHIQDTLKVNPLDCYSPSGDMYVDLYPDLVTITNRYHEPVQIVDRVRIISRQANHVVVSEHTDNMHIVLHDSNHKVTTDVKSDNDELSINTDRAGFYADDNDLHMTAEETTQDVYESQILDELNHMSQDIIEWRKIKNGKDNLS